MPLRQLIEMELIAMDTAEHDRRVRQLSLTPGGSKLEAQLTGSQMNSCRPCLTKLEPEPKQAGIR